jgi:hypothetical protein
MKISVPKVVEFDFSRRPYQSAPSGGSIKFSVVVEDATPVELQALMTGAFSLDTSVIERDAAAKECLGILGATTLREDGIWDRVYADRFAALHGQGHATLEAAKAARDTAASAIYSLRKTGGTP